MSFKSYASSEINVFVLISTVACNFQAPPKQVPKTIENMRVKDETMVAMEDDEVRSEKHVTCMSTRMINKI